MDNTHSVKSGFKIGIQRLKGYIHTRYRKCEVARNVESDKNIVILSSCRLEGLSPNSYIHQVHHTHNTKEVIQYIKYIKGEIDIDERMNQYVFRSCYLDKHSVIDKTKLRQELSQSDIIFIEICSRKKYTKDGYFIHHLAADKGDGPKNNLVEHETTTSEYDLIIQDIDEIESDILNIMELLPDKKVVFVTHIDYGIEIRRHLINEISEICKKHDLPYVNPSDKRGVLRKEMSDSNHYSARGLAIVADYALEKVGEDGSF